MGLTIANAQLDGALTTVRADEGGRIAAIGADVLPEPDDEVIDADGMALLPGFVNGHTHAAMTLFRGYGDDMPLMPWLEQMIWPAEARLESDDVYWGTRLACLEMIRSGTVRFWDMYWFSEATARAVVDSGLTAVVGTALIDARPGGAEALREAASASLEQLAGFGDRVEPGLAPHAIYTVGEQSLRWVAEQAGERGLSVQIHLSETEAEVERCVAEHGSRPARYLDEIGLLGARTVLAHGVWLDDDELELVAERGATIVTNPVANMKLAVGGVFPYPAARDRGVAVGIGTDGAGSNNSLDLLSDGKQLALIQKHTAMDPASITAAEVLGILTGARAPGLGRSGQLAVGEPADMLLIRTDLPELTPGDLTANLIYAASGSAVDTTIVAGRVLMRGRIVEGEAEVRTAAAEQARRLGLV